LKVIIVAAGQGTRLRPLTNSKPKCMVEYNNKPIINYILETVKKCNINDIAVVNGYKKEVLEEYLKNENVLFFTNENFDKTNMVSTLFSAKAYMDDDIIISYADIIYKKEVLEQLIKSTEDFSVIVDRDWKKLWSLRMENPLDDVETLKVVNNKIIELGKKPNSYSDIEGQYIGLIKISKSAIPKVIDFYLSLDKNKLYDGQSYENMYMTSLIQMIIDDLMDVQPIFINGGWIEVDSVEDLEAYKKVNIEFNN